MIQVIFVTTIYLYEKTLRKHFSEDTVAVALEDIEKYGDEVSFHREMGLEFLPVIGMEFEFSLIDFSEDNPHHDYGLFVVTEVTWSEANGKVQVIVERDPVWNFILPREMDQTKWTLGEYGGRDWVRKK